MGVKAFNQFILVLVRCECITSRLYGFTLLCIHLG